MKLDTNIKREINEYLDNISKTEKSFYNKFDTIKKQYLKIMTNDIIDKMYELGTFIIPNNQDLKEKIDRNIYPILDEFDAELAYYSQSNNAVINYSVNVEENCLSVSFDDLSNKLLDSKLKERKQDVEIKSIIMNITDSILTHVAFRNINNPNYINKRNSNYSKNMFELEKYVKEIVLKHMSRFNTDITELYNMIVKILNNKLENFVMDLKDISLKQNDPILEETTNRINSRKFK